MRQAFFEFSVDVRGFSKPFDVGGFYFPGEFLGSDYDITQIRYAGHDVTELVIREGVEVGLLGKAGVEYYPVIELVEEAWLAKCAADFKAI